MIPRDCLLWGAKISSALLRRFYATVFLTCIPYCITCSILPVIKTKHCIFVVVRDSVSILHTARCRHARSVGGKEQAFKDLLVYSVYSGSLIVWQYNSTMGFQRTGLCRQWNIRMRWAEPNTDCDDSTRDGQVKTIFLHFQTVRIKLHPAPLLNTISPHEYS